MAPRPVIELPDTCHATLIPVGMAVELRAGDTVVVTQALGGSITVETPSRYLARIDAAELRRIGLEEYLGEDDLPSAADPTGELSMAVVTETLRTVYDPEIPINVVDLGLIYRCEAFPLESGGNRIEIDMTMTAPGCGMGDVLAADAKTRLLGVPGVAEVEVEIVFEPPWGMEHMSEAAKIQLGLY